MNYFNMSKLNGTLETENGKNNFEKFHECSGTAVVRDYYGILLPFSEAYLKLSQTITIKVFAESR